jgi:hypothetical protein
MKRIMKFSMLALLMSFLSVTLFAQSVTGIWKTIDDETNKQKSHVEIFIKGGKLYGKVLKTFDDDGVTNT